MRESVILDDDIHHVGGRGREESSDGVAQAAPLPPPQTLTLSGHQDLKIRQASGPGRFRPNKILLYPLTS